MKNFLLAMIRFYRKGHAALGGRAVCRYYPTCSQYGLDAIEGYGSFRGLLLTAWRILRCNPLGKSGYDPVPERFMGKNLKKGIKYHSYIGVYGEDIPKDNSGADSDKIEKQ